MDSSVEKAIEEGVVDSESTTIFGGATVVAVEAEARTA